MHKQGAIAWVTAAMAVLGIAGGVTAAVASHRGGAPACPRAAVNAVPMRPSLRTGGHLVPRRVPRRAVICSYIGDAAPQRITLAGELEQLADDLWWYPPAPAGVAVHCPDSLTPVRRLMALTYSGRRTVWVGVDGSGECHAVTNGIVTSRLDFDQVGLSASAGRWRSPGRGPGVYPNPCLDGRRAGRFGAQRAVVPAGVVEVQVCYYVVAPGGRRALAAGKVAGDAAGPLVQALNAGTAMPSSNECRVPLGLADWSAVFRYRSGPPVLVQSLPHCGAPFTNGTLDVRPAREIGPLLEAILATK